MNPLYNTNDSPNNSTQPTKAVNRQGVSVPKSHNTFDMSYYNYMTMPFGKYIPYFVMEGVPGDHIPLSSSHDVRSLPMSSPFLSQLKLNKDNFMVPMQAILPNTWEYIFKTPSQGDDVPDDANCLFPAFSIDTDWNFVHNGLFILNHINDSLSLSNKFKLLVVLESVISQGSLLAQLGYHLNPVIKTHGVEYSFDEFFDSRVRLITSYSFTLNGKTFSEENLDIYQFLSLVRSYCGQLQDFDVTFESEPFDIEDVIFCPSFSSIEDFGTDINLSRVFAYQLACAQFFVNPQVDFLYNAQLYRDNLYTLYSRFMEASGESASTEYFLMNGIRVPYDYTSKVYMYRVLNVVALGTGLVDSNIDAFADYMLAIFGHRESLRFGDYFTDSRTRPLAVGSDSIEVQTDGTVSVVDVSKNIVYQRFRNAVVKLGNNFGDYLRGIFGTTPSPDYHFPKFISHQDFDISGFEVANSTADNQGQLVTNLNTRDDSFIFEVEVDMPCVIIGIASFSVPRVYMQTKERHFFHRDRYDMFNTMLQYIGDQVVYNHERTDLRPNDEIFGYQSRNNEYKQRYGVVSGGFATKLPAWSFVADSLFNPIVDVFIADTQSPDFIRAHDYEFNRFFAQQSGYSLANWFHYILVINNKCVCNRPMEVNPNIL